VRIVRATKDLKAGEVLDLPRWKAFALVFNETAEFVQEKGPSENRVKTPQENRRR